MENQEGISLETYRQLRANSIVKNDFRLGPEEIEVRPTNTCQLNCIGCWYYSPFLKEEHKRPIEWKRQHLTFETFKNLVDDAIDLGTITLKFSGGGDPLAHPQLCDFIEYSHSKGLANVMFSNLLLCKDPVRLGKSGLKYVLVNFSAGSPETYQAYHPNQKGESFGKLVEIIKILVDHKVEINLNCILAGVNYNDVPNMLKVAYDTSKTISFKSLRGSEELGTYGVAMTPAQMAELQSKMPEYIKMADEMGLKHDLPTYAKTLDPSSFDAIEKLPLEKISCYVGYYTTVIQPNGSVAICCHTETAFGASEEGILGNINEKRFKEIWFDEPYKKIREQLKNQEYFKFCDGCSVHFFRQNEYYTKLVKRIEDMNKARELARRGF
jgi:radical SAM protein with 4Fe4S-binding SPASM domain